MMEDVCNALDDDSFGSHFDCSSGFPDCSINRSCSYDLCRDDSLIKPTGDNNNVKKEWSTCSNAQNAYLEKNSLSRPKKVTKKRTKPSNKPRKKRQNITRRPGETDAQLKERRYQAKLKRNRESGMRARKRRQNEAGLLKIEQEQLLEQVHAKRLILRKLEQENAHLQQQLISERAANHPLFGNSGYRMKSRRPQV